MTDKADVGGLLPCPFCGGAVHDVGGGAIWHTVRDGYVTCPIASYGISVERWNRRASPPAPSNVAGLVAELKALYEKATPGPWDVAMFGDGLCIFSRDNNRVAGRVAKESRHMDDDRGRVMRWLGQSPERETNLKFIAALHNAFPALVAALSARSPEGVAVELLRECRTHLDACCHVIDRHSNRDISTFHERELIKRIDALLAGLGKGGSDEDS